MTSFHLAQDLMNQTPVDCLEMLIALVLLSALITLSMLRFLM